MSAIEWTDRTWNPVRGCSRVSEGCRNCYAERQAARFSDPGQPFYGFVERTAAGPRWTGKLRLELKKLWEPLTWRKPARVFVNSMSDLFHENLPDDAILAIFDVMRQCERHTFQILTKRPARMRDFCQRVRFDGMGNAGGGRIWLADDANGPGYRLMGGNGCTGMPWVWLGVSVEDQATADERIPLLLDTPAAVRFVSAEPLLGPVDLTRLLVKETGYDHPDLAETSFDALCGRGTYPSRMTGIPIQCEGPALDWVIVGGESGPSARPCSIDWIRKIVRQCHTASVACFVKQLGARYEDPVNGIGGAAARVNPAICSIRNLVDRKGGDPSEWPENLRVRQFPALEVVA